MATCYRHPDRETGVACSSCGRPICPDCMTPTPVGMRCPECAGDRQPVKTMRNVRSADEPVVTYTIIGICVLAFLASLLTGAGFGGEGGRLQASFALNPIDVALKDEYWQLITYGFLHAGIIHIAFNMYILYFLGTMMEPVLGRIRFLAIYVCGLLGGAAGVMLIEPSVTVGASGAVFGLMGAALVEMRGRGMSILQSPIGILLLLNLGITFILPGISIGGHIGGLIGGTLAAVIVQQAGRLRSNGLAVGVAGCVAVAAVSIAIAVVGADSLVTPVF